MAEVEGAQEWRSPQKVPNIRYFVANSSFVAIYAFKNVSGELATEVIMISEKFKREASGLRRDFMKMLRLLKKSAYVIY